MRALFEGNIESMDYLEIILSKEEYSNLIDRGVAQEFGQGLTGDRELNIFIRVDQLQKELYAVKTGKIRKNHKI